MRLGGGALALKGVACSVGLTRVSFVSISMAPVSRQWFLKNSIGSTIDAIKIASSSSMHSDVAQIHQGIQPIPLQVRAYASKKQECVPGDVFVRSKRMHLEEFDYQCRY